MNILKCNDDAFQKRYHQSLEQLWGDAVRRGDITDTVLLACKRKYDTLKFVDYSAAIEQAKSFLLFIIVGSADRETLCKIRETLPRNAHLLIFEPEPIMFFYIAGRQDLSILIGDERVTILLYDRNHPDEIRDVLAQNISLINLHHVGWMLAAPEYQKRYEEIRVIVEESVHTAGSKEGLAATWMRNFGNMTCQNELYALSHLSENSSAADVLQNIPTRKIPIIIVAAGPSLEKNVDQLKKARGKAIIVAVAHAMETIQRRNVAVDLVAATDAGIASQFLTFDADQSLRLLIASYVDKHLQERHQGRSIYFRLPLWMIESGQTISQIEYPGGGSVATDVFSLFRSAGFSRFILVGQDLAYDKEGNTHTMKEKEQDSNNNYRRQVMGIFGELVETRGDWYSFLKFFQSQLKEHPEIEMIDATEGGAKIEGTKIMTLDAAITELCKKEYPVDDWLRNPPKAITQTTQEAIREELLGYAEHLIDIKNQIHALLAYGEQIGTAIRQGNTTAPDFQLNCDQYERLYQSVINNKKSEILFHYCQDIMQNYISNALRYETEDILKKLDFEKSTFQGILDHIHSLREYLVELLV